MSDVAGYGQNSTQDANSDFNVRQRQIKNLLSKISTAKVVKVTGVSGGGVNPPGTVSVQPMVSMQDGIGNTQEHGIVNGIPVWRYQGGLNAIICDPKEGDIGLLVCSDRDISAVKATSGMSNPGSARQFGIADGIYLGGLLNVAPNQYVYFTEDGIVIFDMNNNTIVLGPSGIAFTDTSGNKIEMTPSGMKFTPVGGTMTVEGNLAVTGNITDSGGSISLTTHVHSGVQAGSSDTGPPVP